MAALSLRDCRLTLKKPFLPRCPYAPACLGFSGPVGEHGGMCTAGWVGLRFCWCCFLLLLLLREGVSFCLLLLQGGVIFLLLLRWGVSCLGCGAFLLLLWGGACCFFCCCSAGESLFLLLLWVCLFVAAAFAVAAGRGCFFAVAAGEFLVLLREIVFAVATKGGVYFCCC